MSSRDAILQSIRRHPLEPTELPSLERNWIQYEDPAAQFGAVLEMVGGRCLRVPSLSDVSRELAALPQFSSAKVRYSAIAGTGLPTLDASAIADPHELETVDFAILPGELAVAENGAVWISDESVRHRAIYFIAQHLALVVPRNRLLHNMHEAYQQLKFGEKKFGCFISGPSKTADIEQSLVIGAHGPRSHVVFLVDQDRL